MRRIVIPFILISIYLLAFLFSAKSFGQIEQQYNFKSLTVDDGLSHGIVSSITQDNFGFMWFGTPDGLNRYDGTKFLTYRKSDSIPYPIGSNDIICLKSDPNGMIWIGTRNAGLYQLDPRTQHFKLLPLPDKWKAICLNSYISSIIITDNQILYASIENSGIVQHNLSTGETEVYEINHPDKANTPVHINDIVWQNEILWIATENSGLIGFNPDVGIINHFNNADPGVDFDFATINEMVSEKHPFLWLGTREKYLHRLNTVSGESTCFMGTGDPSMHLGSITALLTQGTDSLWIGNSMTGLQLHLIQKNQTKIISSDKLPGGINYNGVKSLYRSKGNTLWVGTNGKGANYYSPVNQQFTSFSAKLNSNYSLDFESVRCVAKDGDWVYTGGYFGLNKVNIRTGEKLLFLDSLPVYTLCQVASNDDLLFIGNEGDSHFLFNKRTNKTEEMLIKAQRNNGEKVTVSLVFKIIHLNDYSYLMACHAGLAIVDLRYPDNGILLEHDPDNPSSLVKGEIKILYRDSEDRIWAGSTDRGICLFDKDTRSFSSLKDIYPDAPDFPQGINCINQDHDDAFWFGTNTGLVFFDQENKIVKRYSLKDGLPNNRACGVLNDKDGNIWVSTNNGIACLNTESETFRVYTKYQGLPGNQYHIGGYYKSEEEAIYFCGYDGMVSFTPEKLSFDLPKLKPIFASCKCNNQPIVSDTLLPYRSTLIIHPDEDFLTFNVSGMNYFYSENEYFQYQIAELASGWIDIGQSGIFHFVDQKPGNYTIALRASINQIDWIESEHPLSLTILPKITETIVFKISVIALFLLILFLLIYFRIRFLKQQKLRLNRIVQTRTQELQQANATKDKFFSIIAHDLRSPFSSLLGMTEILSEEWDEYPEKKKYKMIQVVRKNLESSYKLLVNLLDWSRLQQGRIKPVIDYIDIYLIAEKVQSELMASASLKNLKIDNQISPDLHAYGDEIMVSTLFRNLMNNSIKFTPKGGSITLSANVIGSHVKICMTDTGIGMEQSTIKKLFNIELSKGKTGTEGEKGTGLGLMVCSEFIHLMGGKISVKSRPGKGSSFCFTLPVYDSVNPPSASYPTPGLPNVRKETFSSNEH
ncbi:MAG: ATP-binding protein [Bacteroidota bacterium]|nr:ATP-binding protein [Bacteroidota bacterium]